MVSYSFWDYSNQLLGHQPPAFLPEWYLHSVGMELLASHPGDTLIFLNEIGVLTIGMGLATILTSSNPVKNIAIIIMLYVTSIGSICTSLYHILVKGIAHGEWATIIIIGIQMTILTALYPWH